MATSKDANSPTDADAIRRRSDSKIILFADGERVMDLVYTKLRFKNLRLERKNGDISFIIFWDEWVGADSLMKDNEDNKLKQQALDKKQGVKANPKSGRPNQKKPKISNGAKGKKRKNDSSTEKESASTENSVNILIPSILKQQLVDDWEFVNEQDKLVNLLRSPNIDGILEKYLKYRSKKDDMMTDSVAEILKGLRCYFDQALPVILLYNKERKQYRDNVKDDVSPSSIYGAEHLLRFFVKLPELLPYVNCKHRRISDDAIAPKISRLSPVFAEEPNQVFPFFI